VNKNSYILLFFILLISSGVQAQIDSIKNQLPKDTVAGLKAKKIIKEAVVQLEDTLNTKVFKPDPVKVVWMAVILPGAGQIMNKKYWKLPIIYTAFGISAYYLIKNQVLYRNYYEGLVNYSNTNDIKSVQQLNLINIKWITDQGPVEINYALNYYVNIFRSWRDRSFIFLAGTYVLNIIDAAVDAYLFDYDISDNLTMHIEPIMTNSIASRNAFGLKLSFNLH